MNLQNSLETQKGFTLIEMLIYVGLLAIFINASIIFSWHVIFGQAKTRVERNITNNIQLVGQKISYEIRQASAINNLTDSDLCLQMNEVARNPTRIYLQNETVYLGWGGGSSDCSGLTTTVPLTSNSVRLTNLSFTNLSATPSSHVLFNATIEGNTNQVDWQKERTIRTSVEVGR